MNSLSIVSIYVSHNSDRYIKKFSNRHKDELGNKTVLVNSSLNTIEANIFRDFEVINVNENIGFSAANNIGIKYGAKFKPDYFLLINPDVFLPASWLVNVLDVIEGLRAKDVGMFTVPLLGYVFEKDEPSGLVDSLGINHTWFGRWYDVSQGDDADVLDKAEAPYEVRAACGALMLLHKDIVSELLDKNGYVFNESYFMYKEDIELSIRIRELGKKIIMIPSEPVFHCRGWEEDRANSLYWARLLSAKNELKMHFKYCKRFLGYSILKYFYVRFFEPLKLKLTKSFK